MRQLRHPITDLHLRLRMGSIWGMHMTRRLHPGTNRLTTLRQWRNPIKNLHFRLRVGFMERMHQAM